MPTKAQQYSVTDNESNNGGSMHLIQCTGTGPDGKEFVAWTSICLSKRIVRNFMDRLFYVVFALHRGLKSVKHHHHQITPILRAYFQQIRMSSMVDVTTSAFFGSSR